MSQIREIKQLFHAAANFFQLAKRGYGRLPSGQRQMTVKDIANAFDSDMYKNNEKKISIMFSYLTSAAIRISTIYEVLSLRPSNEKLYGDKLVLSNVHYYLRDNVAHREPGVLSEERWKKRQKFIEELSVEKLYLGVGKALISCRNELLALNKDWQALATFVKRYDIKLEGTS